MNQFTVNGVESALPFSEPGMLSELLSELRQHFVSESSLITGIRVDGLDLNDEDEAQLAQVALSEIKSVEIVTSHPREVAEATLQSLLDFTTHLEGMCAVAAGELREGVSGASFGRLLDGINTFSQAIAHAKQILKIGVLQRVNLLEADLVSIMNDLETAHLAKQFEFMAQLLSEHLAANFAQWREAGIPAIIRARDS